MEGVVLAGGAVHPLPPQEGWGPGEVREWQPSMNATGGSGDRG